jgi:hypothetical protein
MSPEDLGMKELAQHVLDIVENSTAAGADIIRIRIQEDRNNNILKISIRDNGCGMPESMVQRATEPFYTTRASRRVGLGLALLETATRRCQGHLELKSSPGSGTGVYATFTYDHIDRAPLGDMASTLTCLFSFNGKVDFIYHHLVNRKHFMLNTRLLRNHLNFSNPGVVAALGRVIQDKINRLEPNTTP